MSDGTIVSTGLLPEAEGGTTAARPGYVMSKWVDVADRVRTVGLAGLAEFLKADRFVNFADLVEVETLEGGAVEFAVERGAEKWQRTQHLEYWRP